MVNEAGADRNGPKLATTVYRPGGHAPPASHRGAQISRLGSCVKHTRKPWFSAAAVTVTLDPGAYEVRSGVAVTTTSDASQATRVSAIVVVVAGAAVVVGAAAVVGGAARVVEGAVAGTPEVVVVSAGAVEVVVVSAATVVVPRPVVLVVGGGEHPGLWYLSPPAGPADLVDSDVAGDPGHHPSRCSMRPTRRHDTRARARASAAASSARVTSPSAR